MTVPRIFTIALAILALTGYSLGDTTPTSQRAVEPRPLALVALGAPRDLPERILGASAEPLIEHLLDDPGKIAQIKLTAPAILRFPGGSQSNYYNWRTGLVSFPVTPASSGYMKFWAAIAPKIARAFPNGVSFEDYTPFAREVGAEVTLVPNLETSTVEEQVAWFHQLAARGILPRHIELGNEFYLAMLGDPAVMRTWPDYASSMAVMRHFEQRLRPIVGVGAKFAVQSAASAFWVVPSDRRPFFRRQLQWDADLAPANWFEAVTVHLYPVPERLMALPGGNTPAGLFSLLMSRADGGVDWVLNDTARRVPGKEIWITEWSPRGGTPPINPTTPDKVTPAMMTHLVTRMTLAFLRHAAVTQALYFMLHSTDGSPFQAYVGQREGPLQPMPATAVLGWFNNAANGGTRFQRVVETGATAQANPAGARDTYLPVEGGLFRRAGGTILILQNVADEARLYDPTQGGHQPSPRLIEMIVEPDLSNSTHRAATIVTLPPDKPVIFPPYSVIRIVWERPTE
jgi:hypothetical protein